MYRIQMTVTLYLSTVSRYSVSISEKKCLDNKMKHVLSRQKGAKLTYLSLCAVPV